MSDEQYLDSLSYHKEGCVMSDEQYLDSLSYETSCAQAAAKGCVVKHPKSNELFVDIDTPEQLATFHRTFEVLKRYFDVDSVHITPSSSGHEHRKHIVVTFGKNFDLDPVDRIALQGALGSDPMREMLSAVRLFRMCHPAPTLFFEKA